MTRRRIGSLLLVGSVAALEANAAVTGRFTRITVQLNTCASQNRTVELRDPRGSVTFDVDCVVLGRHDVSRLTVKFDLPDTTPALVTPGISVSSFESPMNVSVSQTVQWTTPTSASSPPPYFFDTYIRGPDQPATCIINREEPNVPQGTHTQALSLPCKDPGTSLHAAGENEVGTYEGGFRAEYSLGAGYFARYHYDFTPPTGADLSVRISGPTQSGVNKAVERVIVDNDGPETAAGARLVVVARHPDTHLIFKATSRGSCALDGKSTLRCDLGSMAKDDVANVDLEVFRSGSGPAVVSASVDSSTSDPDERNNRAELKTYMTDCGGALCALTRIFCNFNASRAFEALARGFTEALADDVFDLTLLYRLRDEVFARSAAGRRYTELFYAHTAEVAALATASTSLQSQIIGTYDLWKGHIASLVNGQGSTAVITKAQADALTAVVDQVESVAGPALRAVLAREQAALDIPSLVGKSMSEALTRQQATAPGTVTVPAAASIHGVAPAFFHSDLRLLNPSTTAPVTVTARYRCFTGPCPSVLEKSFTVAPRELKVYDDVVATLFAAPETAGAIELTGAVLAESRVYTPSKPAPTTGSDVPGLSADEAYAEAVLSSLSRSGFRTNVGVYNPSADTLDVSFDLYRPDAVKLGTVTRAVAGRSAIQVNDLFAAAGVAESPADAYAIVKADGIHQLFVYATVIDNGSQDSVFVKGRNARGGEPFLTTIPASASIHGVPPAFFHSDVRVFNPASSPDQDVSAVFRCFTGACPDPVPATFTVSPGEMKVLDDVIAGLFGAPETAGAIELSGNVLVESRVYTPSRPAPTTGTGIPGQAEAEATTEAALLSLSHSASSKTGFRANVGLYNPDAFDTLSITISLRRPDGSELARTTRSVPPLTAVQVNDVFASAGVTTDVASAWALVTADGVHPFFAYATVIDNQSQDSVYVRGRPLRAP